MYAEERLEQVEQIINQLVSSEDQYSPLKSLLDSLPTLLKVDEAILSYRKKAKELKEQLKANKVLIKQCGDNLNTYEVRAKSQLEAATQKRDKDNRTLATRLAAVQNSISQMSLDNQLAVKSQEVNIKQESNSIILQVENQLKAQTAELNAKLKNTRDDGKKFQSRLIEGANKIVEEIKSFEDVNKIRIETMQKQGRGNDITISGGKDNLRNWLFREISARLDKGIENCKKTFEKKFKTLNLEYNQQLLSLRGDVELMREGLSKIENNSNQPTKTEQLIETSKKMITQLAVYASEGTDKIIEIIGAYNSDIEKISLKAEDAKEFRLVKNEFVNTKVYIKEIENKIDSDLYVIQENLKKAKLYSKENQSQDKVKEYDAKIKRVQSSYDMNKKATRDRIKNVFDRLNALELKIAIIAKQTGEESKDNEDKSVKASVFDFTELSNIENISSN
jgi:hypothetical protein